MAYSTIENAGIIVTALGAAMIFHASGQQAPRAFLLIAGIYHVANHWLLQGAAVPRGGGHRARHRHQGHGPVAGLVRPIQSGDVNLYLLYVFAVILLAYLLGAV